MFVQKISKVIYTKVVKKGFSEEDLASGGKRNREIKMGKELKSGS